jgi:hypothetical protein
MKKLFILSVLFIAIGVVNAQEPMFVKGDKAINIGIGFDNYTNISLSGEYCMIDGIADKGSIGAGIYAGIGYSILNPWYYSNSFRALGGVRGTFHYPFIEKLDTYAGIGIGLQFTSWSYDDEYWGYLNDGYTDIGLNSGFFVGARYLLTDNFTVFGEAGYGLGYLTAGISFKF